MYQATSNAFSRRGSLLMLGMAGLAALSHHVTASARKRRRNTRKKLNANALCKKQPGQCLDFFLTACEGGPDYLAAAEVCCPALATCDFEGFFTCFEDAQTDEQSSGLSLSRG
jgi:hypothetical protein